MRRLIRPTLVVLGLVALSAAIWFGGPFLGWGEIWPLEGVLIRLSLILVLAAVIAAYYGFRYWRRRRAQKALEAAMVTAEPENEGDSPVLAERMKDALAVLKRSNGKSNFLYDLPWYVIIGPPGVGKTTALVNSGLKFPLAEGVGGAGLAGVGGTRYCDWWFTDEAVLIDTAGRYTTQDSDAESDAKSWQSFLDLLKQHRARQPINGVIVAISLEDLVSADEAEIASHASAIRKRLQEIHERLKIDFPVYVLFTKADLIAGFREFFASFAESRRRLVWGATFQTRDRSKNMIGEVPVEFDLLVKRLGDEVTDRLHEEQDGLSRIAIYGFPDQVALLRDKIDGILRKVFETTRFKTNANLRGFYLSSGTQEGTPIDQVLGAMSREMGAGPGFSHMSGHGKSYFLHDLLTKVIFAESGWVGFDRGALRRAAFARYGVFSLIGVVSVLLLGAWTFSFVNNRNLLRDTDIAVQTYRTEAKDELQASTVSDPDATKIADLLDLLRSLPVGYENRDASTPIGERFGLSQRDRLISASDTSYHQALERMLRTRIILRLERQLETLVADNETLGIYEVLKVYLMLGGKAGRYNEDLVVSYVTRDWENNLYPGRFNKPIRDNLEKHLRAMLDLGRDAPPVVELNGPLVESAQEALARMNIADQAYALIKLEANASAIGDLGLADRLGASANLVFELADGNELSSLRIPMLYTYRGFHEYFLDQLAAVAEKLENDQWVLGKFADASIDQQMRNLGPELLDRYSDDFIKVWSEDLGKLKLKSVAADKPQYTALSALAAQNSPMVLLTQLVATETRLTADPDEPETPVADAAATGSGGENVKAAQRALSSAESIVSARLGAFSRIGLDLALQKSQSRIGGLIGGVGGAASSGQVPGARVEEYFRGWQLMVDGDAGQRAIDSLRQDFYQVHKSLVLSATDPLGAGQANANLQVAIANLRLAMSRLTPTLSTMVQAAVDDFEDDAANSSVAQLDQLMKSTVSRACHQTIDNRYPFDRTSSRDVPLSDFARLFSPNGTIDRFFLQNLAPLTDMSGETWAWKQEGIGKNLSQTTLMEFQRAAKIRDAFFAQGGAMPSVNFTVSKYALQPDVEMAMLTVDDDILSTKQTDSYSQSFKWPKETTDSESMVHLLPEMAGREYFLKLSGTWSLFRLIDKGAPKPNGDVLRVQFTIGGRFVAYNIRVDTLNNPFFLPALTQFTCPSGL